MNKGGKLRRLVLAAIAVVIPGDFRSQGLRSKANLK
jgi:hypothetical protein